MSGFGYVATSSGSSDYTPTVPIDWGSDPPTTVTDALNKLAAFRSGVPGWNLIVEIFVDHVNGSDDNDGLTVGTALKSLNEYQRRLGDQIIDGTVTPFVEIRTVGDTTNSIRFTPRMSNGAILIVYGTRTNIIGLSGTLTTFQAWNSATKTQCEFSFSGLASSWTAAGAVGQFLALPSLGSGDVSVLVGKDLGSKTAVSCGPYDLTNFEPITGSAVAFQGYTLNKITGEQNYLAPDGLGTVVFKDIEMGISSNLHCIEIAGTGQVTFTGCRVFGIDNYALVSTGVVGCFVVGYRNFGNDLLQGNVHDTVGGAILRVHDSGHSDIISNILMLAAASVDPGGSLLIEIDTSTHGAFQGIAVAGQLEINGSFWTKNTNINGNVLQATGGACITYADSSKIGATGTAPTTLYVVAGATSNTLPLVNTARLSGIVQF